MSSIVVAVMGPGEGATSSDCEAAERLGWLVAGEGWITLTGGRPVGVMEAALRGAKRNGGLTLGVLPDRTAATASRLVDIPIVTGMGDGRNIINVLTSRVVFVCGMGQGTASEAALALKSQRPTILLNASPETAAFWSALGGPLLQVAARPEEAVAIARPLIANGGDR